MLILAAASIPSCCYYTGLGQLHVCVCVSSPYPSAPLPVFTPLPLLPAWLPALTTPPSFFLPSRLVSHLPLLRLPGADVVALDKQNQTPSRLVSSRLSPCACLLRLSISSLGYV